jgi:hypothetical protein
LRYTSVGLLIALGLGHIINGSSCDSEGRGVSAAFPSGRFLFSSMGEEGIFTVDVIRDENTYAELLRREEPV